MNTSLLKVERNSFKDNKGQEIKYCKIYCLVPVEKTDNNVGYDVKSFVTKYEHYDKIVAIYKANKPVDISFELVEIQNGLYKKKPTKIGDLVL